MKYILPNHLRLNKKEKRKINNFISKLKESRNWFLLGLLNGIIILGCFLLYYFLK
jgi:hypothetical protein